MEIQEITLPSKTYLVKRQTINIKDIMDKAMWQGAFEQVQGCIQKNNFKAAGPGVALYFSMDQETGITDFGIGMVVEGAAELADQELALVTVPESKAAMMTVRGDYRQLKEAHQQMWQYCEKQGKTRRMPVIEEYTIMGTPDPKEWETNIYYLFES